MTLWRKRSPLAGTGLYIDPRTQNYIWRRVDETTGKRLKRSTLTTHLTIAIRKAAEFEDDYQARVAGLKAYDGWKLPVEPLVKLWIADVRALEATRTQYERQTMKSLKRLSITRLADMDDVPRLEQTLTTLEASGASRKTLVRTVQRPLKQFSRWLFTKRYVKHDPLMGWRRLDLTGVAKRPRRSLRPDEVARALDAADYLDALYRRAYPLKPFFLTLLISAARVGSVLELEVPGLDRERQKLNLGPHVRNKHRGEAALDSKTFQEIVDMLGDREQGPLFPSPSGSVMERQNVRAHWREAFGLGLIRELMSIPDSLAVLVNRFLLTGTESLGRGDTSKLLPETQRQRRLQSEKIQKAVAEVGDAWRERMVGVDVHGLKTTHRTWGELAGVHPLVLDKQCGHSTPAGGAALDAVKALLANPIGRKHYTDMAAQMIDARRAAEAVRKLLDEAETWPPNGPRSG